MLKALTQDFGIWYYYVSALFVEGSCCAIELVSTTVVVAVFRIWLATVLFKDHIGYVHLRSIFVNVVVVVVVVRAVGWNIQLWLSG